MNRRQMFGAVAAFAAAGMFAANYGAAQDKKAEGSKPAPKNIKCMGGNSCKGKSECAVTGAHSCHTQNSCKGKGWVMVASEEECTKAGGKVEKPKKA